MPDKFFRKDLFCSVYFKGADLIQFAVRIKNVPGTIAEVADLLSSRGVNIIHAFYTAFPSQPEAFLGVFADLRNLTVDPESLVKEIKKIDIVIDVRVSKPIIEGFIVDDIHFPLMVSGERSIVLKVKTLVDSFKRLREKFGSGADFILYEMGKAAGEERIKKMHEDYGLEDQAALKLILAERAAKGWGVPRIEKYDEEKKKATIIVHELFECLPFKDGGKEPRSQFFRGYLSGVFGFLFNGDVSVREVECIGKRDENCKFICEVSSHPL